MNIKYIIQYYDNNYYKAIYINAKIKYIELKYINPYKTYFL